LKAVDKVGQIQGNLDEVIYYFILDSYFS